MFRTAVISVVLVCVMRGVTLAEGVDVPLTVTNRTPLERWELAAGGVPLPMGAAADTEDFRIFDASGATVPAQFTVLNRWPADESLRWVLVQFPVRLAAEETRRFSLKADPDTPAAKPEKALAIHESDDRIQVDTGCLVFTVGKERFAILDSVGTYGGEKKLPELAGIGAFGAGVVIETAGGETFDMVSAPPRRVVVEDAGPLRATILAEGRHSNKDGKTLFDYQVRIYASAGSRAVRVQYVFTYGSGGWPAEMIDLKHIYLKYKPGLALPISRSAVSPGGVGEAEPASKDPLRLASLIKPGGGGERFYEGPAVMSAVDRNGRGYSASVRWFWQLRPKSMEAAQDGALVISLADAREEGAELVHFYPGMSKTHDILFHFRGSGASSDTEHAAAGFQQPFFVKCPADWYCQKTLSLGRLVSADYAGYLPELKDARAKIDDSVAEQVRIIRDLRKRPADKNRDIDSYTMIHFGDGFHHFFGSDHKEVQWDNCYYSYTHLLTMQYARTADDLYLDTLREAATFEGDISIVWHEHEPGAPRVNPGAYHVGGFSGFNRFTSDTWNFYKPIGMLELFYLTGDRRHEEAGLLNARWMLTHNGYNMLNNPRSCGAGLRAAVHSYLATGDTGFLRVARRCAMSAVVMQKTFGHFAPVKNSIFMAPNALEGLCVYHELTGDEVLTDILPEMVKAHCDRFAKDPGALNYAYMTLYAAALTGDGALKDKVLKGIAARGKGIDIRKGEHAIKDFAIGNRGLPLAMWYLSDLAKKPSPWAGKPDLGEMPVSTADCPRIAVPVLDGKRAAGEWDKAAELSLVFDPNPLRKLAAPTKVRVAHDLVSLYILVLAEEPKMGEVVTEVTEEGGPVYRDDAVEIYVSPVPRRAGLKLVVNAAGVKAASSRGFEKDRYKAPAPADISAAAGRWEKGWLLEIAVPLAKLDLGAEPKAGMELGFNCVRFRRPAPGEHSTWIGAVNQMDSTGTLVLR